MPEIIYHTLLKTNLAISGETWVMSNGHYEKFGFQDVPQLEICLKINCNTLPL